MNRRKFVSLALLMFAPIGNARVENYNVQVILNRIVNPFGDLIRMDLDAVEEWISTLPNISNVDIFSEYILSQIELDYIENRVVLVEGIVLSETEVKLYRAREIYA